MSLLKLASPSEAGVGGWVPRPISCRLTIMATNIYTASTRRLSVNIFVSLCIDAVVMLFLYTRSLLFMLFQSKIFYFFLAFLFALCFITGLVCDAQGLDGHWFINIG